MRKMLLTTVAVLLAGAATAQEPIRIGLSTTMTGVAAVFGQHDKWGLELAISEINAAGGILGRKVEGITEDNRCNPAEGVKAATKLLNETKVHALIGAMCSSVTLATMPLVQRAEIPFVVTVSTAASIAQQSGKGGNQWTFKTNPADDTMAEAIAEKLKEMGIKTMAFMAEETDYGRGGVKGFAEALEKRGIKVVAIEYFPQGLPDFSTLLTKLASIKPDRVGLYALRGDNESVMRAVEGLEFKIPFAGRLDLNSTVKGVSPQYVAKGGLDGYLAINPYQPDWDEPKNLAFVEKFKKFAKGEQPLQQGFYTYEGMLLLADAIKRAGSTEAKAIRDALKATKFPSMMGATYEFDDNHLAHNNALIQEIKGGKIIAIALQKT
jgi:branched-chain amino acid transport system substrate-binding protein